MIHHVSSVRLVTHHRGSISSLPLKYSMTVHFHRTLTGIQALKDRLLVGRHGHEGVRLSHMRLRCTINGS